MTMTEQTPTEPTPTEPARDYPTPPDAVPPRGLKGWLARRAESFLHKPRRARPALSEPGERQVVLQLVGHDPVRVVTVIMEATGLDFMSAGSLARQAPVVVVSKINEASADRLVRRLQKAGAKAIAGEQYKPQ
jgi:ribosomal protein L7/L12